MVRVSFKGPLKRVLGVEDFDLEDGDLDEILEAISRRTGVSFEIKESRLYMRIDNVKFTVSILYNGVNVLREGIERFEGGNIDVITPLGGG